MFKKQLLIEVVFYFALVIFFLTKNDYKRKLKLSQTFTSVIEKKRKKESIMKQTFKITGMTCQHCVKNIETAVQELNGLKKIKIHLKKETALVHYNEEQLSSEAIINKITEAGYQAEVI